MSKNSKRSNLEKRRYNAVFNATGSSKLARLEGIEKRANEVLHETYTTFDEKKIIDFIINGEGEGK